MEDLDGIHIVGGKPLNGQITVQGSKNAALPIIAAAVLGRGISVLEGCPRITDVFCMEEILRGLGARSWWEGRDLYLDCRFLDKTEVAGECAGRMRSSVILLGALLGRMGESSIGYPGGCVIGKRPVDLHLYALRCLGADLRDSSGKIHARGALQGGVITFPKISVGATEQAILAGVCAKGLTIVENCAREPEIFWLCRCLQEMGAKICGEGTGCIRIQGGKNLRPFKMKIPSDRIAAGTYILAGAATRGRVTLCNAPVEEMKAFLKVYRKMGGQYDGNSGKLVTDSRKVCHPVPYLETDSYPGFPTDLQSPLLAVLAGIPGTSVLRERIFEARYGVAEELNRMGAQVDIRGQEAWVNGRERLMGATVWAKELRGGAALILAGLSARGETFIEDCQYIWRGYEDICGNIAQMGGTIERKPGKTNYESIELPKKTG